MSAGAGYSLGELADLLKVAPVLLVEVRALVRRLTAVERRLGAGEDRRVDATG